MRTGSLPLISLGTLLVIVSLWKAPWPADLLKPIPNYTVSHHERFLGRDAPDGVDVGEHPEGYLLFRIFDGVVYLALVQVILATLGLLLLGSRFLLVLVMLAGLYGAIYSVTLGLVIGPQMAFIGFSCIFFAAFISWLTGETYGTHPPMAQRDSRHSGV